MELLAEYDSSDNDAGATAVAAATDAATGHELGGSFEGPMRAKRKKGPHGDGEVTGTLGNSRKRRHAMGNWPSHVWVSLATTSFSTSIRRTRPFRLSR